MFSKAIKGMVIGLALMGFGSTLYAEESVSVAGNASVLSNYIWRGVPQNGNNTSFSGGLDFTFAAMPGLTLGNWNAVASGAHETDYYAIYEMESGLSFGLTMYSYDWKSFGTDADGKNIGTQNEVFVGYGMDAISATLYLVLPDASTKGAGEKADESIMLNWIEIGYSTAALGYDVGITYGGGTYNHEWLGGAGIAPETSGIITLSMSKAINDQASASFNKTQVVQQTDKTDRLHNEFWMSVDYSF
ncbi:MAG: TorF family putative porin [bacterium]|nr:TorF family putative porin [bacterium]